MWLDNQNWFLNLNLTVNWGKKQLVDFGDGKYSIGSFDVCNNSGAIDVKMDGSVLKEKSTFKILRTFLF